MGLRANFHTHTNLCDGNNRPEEMVIAAIKKNFKHLGFSGHMDPDIHMDFPKYLEIIRGLEKKYKNKLDIICGVELDTLYDPTKVSGVDYIIGSTHFMDLDYEIPLSVDNTPEMMELMAREFYSGDYYKLAKDYYRTEAQVIEKTGCDMIGHFDLVTRFNDDMHFIDESDSRYYMPALETMEYLVKQGIPFEINCGAINRGRKAEAYPNNFLLRELCRFGGEIFINSDAHSADLLDGGFDMAVKVAIAAGFTHVNVFDKTSGKLQIHQLALDGLID